MKRFYTALMMLLVILFGSMFHDYHISSVIESASEPLRQAEDYVLEKDFHTVDRLLEQSHTVYLSKEGFLCACVHEKLLDTVRLSYAQTKASIRAKDARQLLPALAALEQALDDVRRTEIYSLQNIF